MANLGANLQGQSYVTEARETFSLAAELFSTGLTAEKWSLLDGARIKVRASGLLDTDASPGTIRVRLYVGSVAVVDYTSGTLTASVTDAAFLLNAFLTVRARSGLGTVIGAMSVQGGAASSGQAAGTAQDVDFNAASRLIRLSVLFSDTGNVLDLDQIQVEVNPA
jgi:hypothetical protein